MCPHIDTVAVGHLELFPASLTDVSVVAFRTGKLEGAGSGTVGEAGLLFWLLPKPEFPVHIRSGDMTGQ